MGPVLLLLFFSVLPLLSGVFAISDIYVDLLSCFRPAPGIGITNVRQAVDESISMGANAVTLIDSAVGDPSSKRSKFISVITNKMLGCDDPSSASCQKAKSWFQSLSSLKRVSSPGPDSVWVYCSEAALNRQIASGGGPPNRAGQKAQACERENGGGGTAVFFYFDVIVLCPSIWTEALITQDKRTTISDWRSKDWTAQANGGTPRHIDTLRTLSSGLMHELLHAVSKSTLLPGNIDVHDIRLELPEKEGATNVGSYGFRDCAMLALYDDVASRKYPVGDVYANLRRAASGGPSPGPLIVTDAQFMASMSCFNADSLRLTALMLFMINNVFATNGEAKLYIASF